MFDYDALKSLARETGCRVSDFLVLAPQNDPYYAGQPGRRERAEWFGEIWERFGFRPGAHLRRIHYTLVSQAEPVQWPDGKAYENTLNDWTYLISASLSARYLRLIPDGVLIDRRNPDPVIHAEFRGDPEPEVKLSGADFALDIPDELPLPELHLEGFDRDQDHLVELWVEKSTMNDVLLPLARRLRFNLITGVGEMSETRCRDVMGRALNAGRPARILYISDFDPAGRSMPVAVARKLQWMIHDACLDADVQLHPIALTPEQCVEYRLPRTPIKETERRAGRFEERFGAGATELDALEALYPGQLEEIVTREASRYLDRALERRVFSARHDLERRIRNAEEAVRERHTEEIARLTGRWDGVLAELADIEADAADLFERMEPELRDAAPAVNAEDVPTPEGNEPIAEPLFDSRRDWLEQLDHYKLWQGK